MKRDDVASTILREGPRAQRCAADAGFVLPIASAVQEVTLRRPKRNPRAFMAELGSGALIDPDRRVHPTPAAALTACPR